MIHPTTGALGEASLQVFWPSTEYCVSPERFTTDQTWKAAIVDTVLVNGDRNGANWMGVPVASPEPRLILIDHGLTLSLGGSINSTFAQLHHGQIVPKHLLQDVRRFSDEAKDSYLVELVGIEVVSEMVERAEKMCNSETFS